jgi:hypothetical protein
MPTEKEKQDIGKVLDDYLNLEALKPASVRGHIDSLSMRSGHKTDVVCEVVEHRVVGTLVDIVKNINRIRDKELERQRIEGSIPNMDDKITT